MCHFRIGQVFELESSLLSNAWASNLAVFVKSLQDAGYLVQVECLLPPKIHNCPFVDCHALRVSMQSKSMSMFTLSLPFSDDNLNVRIVTPDYAETDDRPVWTFCWIGLNFVFKRQCGRMMHDIYSVVDKCECEQSDENNKTNGRKTIYLCDLRCKINSVTLSICLYALSIHSSPSFFHFFLLGTNYPRWRSRTDQMRYTHIKFPARPLSLSELMEKSENPLTRSEDDM